MGPFSRGGIGDDNTLLLDTGTMWEARVWVAGGLNILGASWLFTFFCLLFLTVLGAGLYVPVILASAAKPVIGTSVSLMKEGKEIHFKKTREKVY